MQFKRKQKKITQKIVFLSVLAALICALTVSAVLLSKKSNDNGEGSASNKEQTPIRDGEGRYNSYPVAYPAIDDLSDITLVSIENENGTYFMAVPPDSSSDSYEFFYDVDEEGNYKYYSPDILEKEDDMTYDDLYAKVKGDGYDRIPMLTYLLSAIRAPYFDYRIDLSSDTTERSKQLAAYGLSPDSGEPTGTVRVIRFSYTNDDGETESHKIEIGAHTVTGEGYYYRVDGRDYIYVTRETNYFKYALVGIEAYINPVLVAGGLDNDSHALYAPYLTPDYRQWKTELHELGALPTDSGEMKNVTDVFAKVNAYSPQYVVYDNNTLLFNNYVKDELGSYIFNLTELADNKLYPYLIKALAGREIGSGGLKQSILYERQNNEGEKYRYIIHSVDAVITDNGDIEVDGTAVGKNRYIRVTYDLYTWDGEGKLERVNNVTRVVTDDDGKTEYMEFATESCGIIDLEYLKKIGVDEQTLERLGTVGDLEPFVSIDVTYEKKNTEGMSTNLSYKNMTYYLDSVLEIYEPVKDEEGKVTSYKRTYEVSDTSLVVYRYYYVCDGKAQNASIGYISMSAAEGEQDTESLDKVRAAIKKWMKSSSDSAIEVMKKNVYTDIVSDYILYEFEEIEAYISGEIVTAFRFVNVSERDPFYGESFYERSEDFMLYAVSQDACEKVVKLLGGIAETSQADGLVGKETVALGISPEQLKKYNCYAHIVRFSLPRELYVSVETDENEYDDYGWLRTLDFVLYVSDPVWDPDTESTIRYVASEMYDIIVKIDADELGYLDLDSVNFWARRNLMLIDSKSLGEIYAEFMTDDINGKFKFSCDHYNVDVGSANYYDWIRVRVDKVGESNFKTRFDEYIEYVERNNIGTDKLTLEDFYDYLAGGPVSSGNDSMGTGMFKEILLLLYFTTYTNTLTEQEQTDALESGALMRLTVKLDGTNNANADTEKSYCYEFYRCDDRRIMVRIYEKKNGKVIGGKYASDFYITSLAFEKIISNFIGLLNGEEIDINDPYPDFKPIG